MNSLLLKMMDFEKDRANSNVYNNIKLMMSNNIRLNNVISCEHENIVFFSNKTEPN